MARFWPDFDRFWAGFDPFWGTFGPPLALFCDSFRVTKGRGCGTCRSPGSPAHAVPAQSFVGAGFLSWTVVVCFALIFMVMSSS